MDNVSKEKRSEIMRKVKNTDTRMEIALRSSLWRKGTYFRVKNKKYLGNPDIVIKKSKTVIFVDSCFWHGCKLHLRLPKSNTKYWTDKIKKNKDRDAAVGIYYKKNDWQIIRVWEHEIKSANQIEACTTEIKNRVI